MDKDLLRLVIIAIGGTVILGMVLWSIFKSKKTQREIDFYDTGNPLENVDSSLIVNTDNDDFDILPIGSAYDSDSDIAAPAETFKEPQLDFEPQVELQQQGTGIQLPKIIQFSIVATADEGFNGENLFSVFEQVGLEYGGMKVFERLDEQNRVDYAVASMVEPGIFPDTGLDTFNSPGIVFFLQPDELDNPLEIFDDYIETINWLASELNGVVWDHTRQPLTKETINAFRVSLAV